MDRDQACIRVDQLLGWKSDEMLTGRCPLCGAIAKDMGEAPEDWLRGARGQGANVPSKFRGFEFIHEDDCQLARVNNELEDLCRRFKIPLEPVHIPVNIGREIVHVQVLRRKTE
ncbi:MAG: hypothetical protein WEB06_11985 [Actinomycetota bacterium]